MWRKCDEEIVFFIFNDVIVMYSLRDGLLVDFLMEMSPGNTCREGW